MVRRSGEAFKMRLSLNDVRRLAAEVAREEDPALEVLAATSAEGATNYAEVILALHGEQSQPRRVLVGVSRKAPESDIRAWLRHRLREHLRYDVRPSAPSAP
jgi:hypothetical protein